MYDKDDAQIVLVGGIIITIAILSFGVIITSLSDVTETIDKESYLLYNYNNIRKEFGLVLKQNLQQNMDNDYLDSDIIGYYFNDSRDILVFAESSHGVFFDAELIRIVYKGENINGLEARLTLSNEYDYISEEVTYYFG